MTTTERVRRERIQQLVVQAEANRVPRRPRCSSDEPYTVYRRTA